MRPAVWYNGLEKAQGQRSRGRSHLNMGGTRRRYPGHCTIQLYHHIEDHAECHMMHLQMALPESMIKQKIWTIHKVTIEKKINHYLWMGFYCRAYFLAWVKPNAQWPLLWSPLISNDITPLKFLCVKVGVVNSSSGFLDRIEWTRSLSSVAHLCSAIYRLVWWLLFFFLV